LAADSPVVRVAVRLDDRIRPIWTVTGMIRGSAHPEQIVIVGNHRDAWVYGGVDPSSGSAALMELARTLGDLRRSGWQPKRSILFASWDAEEFTLTSSTEWGEQHADRLRREAIAYINVDSAASGSRFTATAVPALNRLITEAAGEVRDPIARVPVSAVARERRARDRGALPGGSSDSLIDNRLGITWAFPLPISRSTGLTASITRSTTRIAGSRPSGTQASDITEPWCSYGESSLCGSQTPTRFRSTTRRTRLASCHLSTRSSGMHRHRSAGRRH
jgi:hypothetical protein